MSDPIPDSPPPAAPFDLLIRGGTVVLEDRAVPLDVALRGGRIAALLPPGAAAVAARVVAADGLHVLPGAIDVRFPLRAPTERGAVERATSAAAAAGVTTVLVMPTSVPSCSSAEVLEVRREHVAARTHVHFGLYGAPGRLGAEEVIALAEAGAIGFEVTTSRPPPGRADEYDGVALIDTAALYRCLRAIRETGLVLCVHAEDDALRQQLLGELGAVPRGDRFAAPSPPPAPPAPLAEAVAIASMLTLNQAVGARLHLARVSSRRGLETLRAFRRRGDEVSAEAWPRFLRAEPSHAEAGTGAADPLRRALTDVESVWEGLLDGSFDAIGSGSVTTVERQRAVDDARAAHGVEPLVVLVLDAVAAGQLTLVQAVRLLATGAARRFGLYPRKGTLREGSDADLTLVDLQATTTIEPPRPSLAAATPEPTTYRARIAGTIVAGEVVFDGEEILNRPGSGAFVRP